jgi:hypothetical protein
MRQALRLPLMSAVFCKGRHFCGPVVFVDNDRSAECSATVAALGCLRARQPVYCYFVRLLIHKPDLFARDERKPLGIVDEGHGSGPRNGMDADTCIKVDHRAALDLLGNSKPANGLANVDPHAASCGMPGCRLVVAPSVG